MDLVVSEKENLQSLYLIFQEWVLQLKQFAIEKGSSVSMSKLFFGGGTSSSIFDILRKLL